MLRYSDLIRNSRIFKMLSRDFDNDSLGHCYLLISSDTVAVKEFFTLLSCYVYCDNGACLECAECQRVLNKNNVDIVNIDLSVGKALGVKEIESVLSDVYKKGYSSDKKLYFFQNADKLNVQTQNKLLKILEEPPKSVHFFFSTSVEGAILDTVKSRARRIYMEYFSKNDLVRALGENYSDTDSTLLDVAASCSNGSLEQAERLLSDETFFSKFNAVFEMLLNVKKSPDVIRYAKSSLFDKDNISGTLDMIEIILRDIVSISVNNTKNTTSRRVQEMIFMSKSFSNAAISNIVDKINLARKKLKVYCNSSAVGENLLYTILEVKFKCRK